MQQIIYFYNRLKYFLFYLILLIISFIFTINNFNFHKSKFTNSASEVTGYLFSVSSDIKDYLNLKVENEALSEENTRLKNLLELKNTSFPIKENTKIDANYFQKYTYTKAKVINNTYNKTFNYIIINKGNNSGIESEMAVINSKGVIGIVENTSQNYSKVRSILNKKSKINVRIKGNTFYFGTLKWDGKHYTTVQFYDLEIQAPIKIGDTIETGGMSTIFPTGIPIGKASKVYNGSITTHYKIDVELFNDMSNIGYVYIIKNLHKKEINSLENTKNE